METYPNEILIKREVYISSAVNSIGKCISWKKWLVCGMSKSVVLIDQKEHSSKIIQQFNHHKNIVTCVTCVDDNIIVSGDNSGVLVIWWVDDHGNLIDFRLHSVDTFSSGITDISAVKVGNSVYVLCCCEERWEMLNVSDTREVVSCQSRGYGPLYVHSVNICMLESSIFITCGLSDGRVICQCYNVISNELSSIATLSGHEDAVMAIDTVMNGHKLLIATASLDCFVRIWEVVIWSQDGPKNEIDIQQILDENIRVEIRLAAVLAGHENWVTSVTFLRNGDDAVLVSTSMDKSVIVWQQAVVNGDDSIYREWSEDTRLGQVGGNGLGFIGGAVSPCGTMIVSVGYQGAMIVWAWDNMSCMWHSVVNVGGHFDVVEDLAWEADGGRYLITVAKDQTTRVHAPWHGRDEWHEVGRPQVHGFDLTCVSSLNAHTFISGADEKISRVFAMNRTFGDFLSHVTNEDFSIYDLKDEVVASDALGLSNKAAQKEECKPEQTSVPKEENIVAKTLWPEVTKLYGHVYEVFRISSHRRKNLVATCCKAVVHQYADIIIWDASSWAVIQRLSFHQWTVRRVQFSKDGNKMVSVSKDRQWALWKNRSEDGVNYELTAHSSKPQCHSQIIWDTDWTVDDAFFVTVSRDKKMMMWDGDSGALIGAPLVMGCALNSVSTLPQMWGGCHVFAVGLESGEVHLVVFDPHKVEWHRALSIPAHYDSVTRLMFRPVIEDAKCLLATCSKDRFVKVYEVSLE